MSPRAGSAGAVVVDCAALQSPTSRGRGIGRYARDWAVALEQARPDLVGAYLLDPSLPPPGELDDLLATGKVAYRGARLPAGARVLHCLSPLDTAIGVDTLWPADALEHGLRRSATVYDLIPADDPATHLADPLERRRYRTRLEALRAADQLQVISRAVGDDLMRLLEVSPAKVVLTGAAPAARFGPRHTADAGFRAALGRLEAVGVREPFVLYPTGSHPRKNNEGLLAAWARLSERLRREVQLVLVGDLPSPVANHLRHLAGLGGFAQGLVLTGEVDDETLVACYQEALLVCFPSLAEGYGLPVAEALACGTPVLASDRPPLDELLGADARLDPTDPDAMAAALEQAIEDPARRARLLEAGRSPASWAEVARRSAAALEELAAGPTRPWPVRRRRPVLALVSPFPPAESGVAGYSARLATALAGSGTVHLDVFADGPALGQVAPEGVRSLHRVEALEDLERLAGRYDEVVYAFGNSHHHLGALAMLRRRPGSVLAHDVRLTNLYRHEAGEVGRRPGGLARAIQALYGPSLPSQLGQTGELAAAELDRYGLLMAREVIAASTRFLVSSAAAVELARADAQPEDAAKIGRLPFAFAPLGRRLAAFATEAPPRRRGPAPWSRPGPAGPVVAHFGIVDPSKQPFLLLEAVAELRARYPGLLLAFVGPVSEALAAALHARARQVGLEKALVLTGPLPPDGYDQALGAATLAVQLRASSNGEASAAVGDCLAAGLPTVVSDLGWARELPEEAVVRVDRRLDPAGLAGQLAELLEDEVRREALGRDGRAEADRRSFEATATALLEALLEGRPPKEAGAS